MQRNHITYPIRQVNNGRVVMALGYFDGIHLGHQAVLAEASRLAEELQAKPAVMTFSPHPREVLGKEANLRFMTPLPEKMQLFEKQGLQHAYIMKFDEPFAKLSADQFVEEILLPLGVVGVVTGFNYRFGRFAAGTPQDLERLGQGRFVTRQVGPVLIDQVPVSSTRIREALTTGQVELANHMLGRPYRTRGTVIHGDKRGRLMGFPTANLQELYSYFPPNRGVYVVRVFHEQRQSYGIMNIGIRPTFTDPVPRERYEVHLLDFQGDLYDQVLDIEYLHYIRPEQKFPSMDALVEQIRIDRQQAIGWLSTHTSTTLV
ncbi:riboflavin kinase / FMN adenylyltransferase [Thermoactinomyces sp. DSM 45891]|uniref:bifunctional riboflavin kinase/FAD synthetase n=1 Tax=Thermoactinomyces sp. DSM 45891 TaxID=1761907 RepID=UPI0009171980|nr:bifunctional riboflavin kinase/FAD synthetase [Thermoactinomyces sp. DSM 45891]SFX35057.1 riboflavin kinase / FMN adenylyltransferase [Thermoactinomyces sp. DSM 45891]